MVGVRIHTTGRRTVALAAVVAFVAVAWLLAARVLGPTDLWDQTQPKTISYTTDIIANGHWLLPIERGEHPATKPPLYNWLAAPAVMIAGFNSEFAHKLPSVIALLVTLIALPMIGRRLTTADNAANGGLIGWLAVIMCASSYALFKLGYLARPDMLLVMWMTLGWIAVTCILIEPNWTNVTTVKRFVRCAALWGCVAAGGLTKGPGILVLIVFAFIAPRIITGRWRDVHRLQWWWGLPASLMVIGLWVAAAWRVDPQHVHDQLWYAEFFGRVTGTGPEGSRDGLLGLLRTIHLPAFYFLTRFAPWSVLTVAAVVTLLRRDPHTHQPQWRQLPTPTRCWLVSAAVFVVVTIGLYTLSSSKKPDYIAPAVPMAALLGAWWVAQLSVRRRAVLMQGVIAASIVTLSAMTVFNIRQPAAPSEDFAQGIQQFIDDAEMHLNRRPAPVVFCWTGYTHLQAMLGSSMVDDTAAFEQQYEESSETGGAFWVIAGRRKGEPPLFDAWVADRKRFEATVEVVALSAHLPRAAGWPEQCGLYWVQPQSPDDEQ